MKCGTEIKDEAAFCDNCLTQMAKYPVRPNVVVQLPPQQSSAPAKKKRERKNERDLAEQILRLKSVIRWLSVILAVALLAFLFTAFVLIRILEAYPVGWDIFHILFSI